VANVRRFRGLIAGRRRKRSAAWQIVQADGEIFLRSSNSFVRTAQAIRRRANRFCRRREQCAVEQIVQATGENDLLSDKTFVPTA
jgi:hypothetical protein